LLTLGKWLVHRHSALERHGGLGYLTTLLVAVSAIITILHLAEASLWALLFRWWSLFPDMESSFYFSLTSYTTAGYGDLLMPQRWRFLGCVEAVTGVLLSGLSTAFLFVVLSTVLRIVMQTDDNEKES
jgi:hypothetical protein